MHRHGYKGSKLGRERGQRRALMKGLADDLVKNGSIETTLAKAKELIPYTEKLITKAKKPSLANRRLVIAKLNTRQASNKLFDDIAPKLTSRSSGHLRIERTTSRRGDNAQLARISFVDDLKQTSPAVASSKKKEASKMVLQSDSTKKATTKKKEVKK